jgi:site-specific recombinase XerC
VALCACPWRCQDEEVEAHSAVARRGSRCLERAEGEAIGRRLKAGQAWQDGGLVITSAVGTSLDASHVQRAFKKICEDAGIGPDWTPRELRHTFAETAAGSPKPKWHKQLIARLDALISQAQAG